MSSKKIKQIEKRLQSYEEMDYLPAEITENLPQHYLEDIPVLLAKIEDLQGLRKNHVRLINKKNETIEKLQRELRDTRSRLKQVIEKADWHSDVFGKPDNRVVSHLTQKPRITDNRT